MFTGIVEETAEILSRSGNVLTISRPGTFTDIEEGSSICVSGTCLTVTAFDSDSMTFDVVDETLRASKLGALQQGDHVNLERSLKADGRFEGHVVQGHVEGTGQVSGVGTELSVEIPEQLLQLVVPKGSIAIDGVSLTVAKIDGNACTIALIPHTREQTTLGTLNVGDSVNIETDILVRSLHHSTALHA